MKISKTAKFKNFLTENNFDFIAKIQKNGEKNVFIIIDDTEKEHLVINKLNKENCAYNVFNNHYFKVIYVSF